MGFFRTLSIVVLMGWAGCATAGDSNEGGGGGDTPDASFVSQADAAPGLPDAAPGTPDAKPPSPDAAPGSPDAAPQAAQCTQDTTASCGDLLQHGSINADASISNYSCEQFATDGVENIYLFQPSVSGQITVTLDVIMDDPFLGDDLDLYVMQTDCDVAACMAQAASAGDESLVFTATAGSDYYIAVERFSLGLLGFGDYDLGITCP